MWLSPECQKDLVSVIVPTYNRASVLTDAMNSVYGQTYRPIELIIVDDGSTDPTKDIVATFSEQVANDGLFKVKYIPKSNEGCQAARNHGLRCSAGDFIQLLDSDDVLCRNKISNAVRLYKSDATIDLVFSKWVVDNGRRIIPMSGPPLGGVSLLSSVVSGNLCIFSPIYRRNILVRVGPFNEELLEAHDIEYSTRVMQCIRRVERDDECGGVYRIGKTASSITGSCTAGTLQSEWHVNQWQKRLILKEPAEELKDRALALLSRRAYSIASRSLSANCPSLGLRILVTEYRIWLPLAPKQTLKRLILVLRLSTNAVMGLFWRFSRLRRSC
ncbi:glycosyltransferase family A protein [Ectothiorhodospira haloalkaliphila]|uniref:glycosyltransferase family 2 protein n=1 Tax=Ectothiorhodospira haloalkaliphila TaxID=421628 RepID=UPI0009FBDFA6